MQDNKERAFYFFTRGYSDPDICRVCDISPHLLREWKKTVEWSVAIDTWQKQALKDSNARLLSNTDFIIDNATKLINAKDTPATVKADLIKYMGNRIWGNTSVIDLSEERNKGDSDAEKGSLDHVTGALENLKKKFENGGE